jgi:rhomboid protease GluP
VATTEPAVHAATDMTSPEARENAEFLARLREVTPRIAVVATIVVVNVAVFIAMQGAGVSWIVPTVADLVKWGGNYGPRTLGGQPWRIVSSAFVHAGIIHLAMNMLALWSSGRVIERIFGSARLAVIYFCAAVTGGIASVAVHPETVSVGASGAVFGVYGALGAFILRQRGGIPGHVISRLGRIAGGFVVYNILYGFSQSAIDNAAHVGGLCGGVVAGAWLARPLVPDRPGAPMHVLAAFALALIALVGAARALPTPPDLQAAVEQFGAAEARILDSFNALLTRVKKGEIDDETFASGIEDDVLPPWRAARTALASPRRWTKEQRVLLERLDRYAEAREHAWVLVARAGHSQSIADSFAAKDAQAEVERLMEDFKKKP